MNLGVLVLGNDRSAATADEPFRRIHGNQDAITTAFHDLDFFQKPSARASMTWWSDRWEHGRFCRCYERHLPHRSALLRDGTPHGVCLSDVARSHGWSEAWRRAAGGGEGVVRAIGVSWVRPVGTFPACADHDDVLSCTTRAEAQ